MTPHKPAAYDGMCITCGLSRMQQLSYPDCTARQLPIYQLTQERQNFIDRHIECAARCEYGWVLINVVGELGPHLCNDCLETL